MRKTGDGSNIIGKDGKQSLILNLFIVLNVTQVL